MNKRAILIMFIFLQALPPVAPAPGEVVSGAGNTRWFAYIHVAVEKVSKRLVLGEDAKAAEEHDYWEAPVPRMFLDSALVRPYFYHPEWQQETPFFWRDIRPPGGLPRTWEFIVRTKKPNMTVKITWDLKQVRKGITLYLKRRQDKNYINLQKEKSYAYRSSKRGEVFLIKAE